MYLSTPATNLTQGASYYISLPATASVSEGDETIAYIELNAEP